MMIFNLHPYKTREEFDGIRLLIARLGFRTQSRMPGLLILRMIIYAMNLNRCSVIINRTVVDFQIVRLLYFGLRLQILGLIFSFSVWAL